MAARVSLDAETAALERERARWGLPAVAVYGLACSFYRDNEGKTLHLSYEDKLKLIAYTQQATHGPFNEKTAPPLGFLDVIGKDRRSAWLKLGNMSQSQAMVAFVHMIDRLAPTFNEYIEANKKETDKRLETQMKEEESKKLEELQRHAEEEQCRLHEQKSAEEEQIRQIKDALNKQTYEQFLQYAAQQFPGNPDQQAILVRQLQDKHYDQYMQQVALKRANEQCLVNNNNTTVECSEKEKMCDKSITVIDNTSSHISEAATNHLNENAEDSSPEHPDESQSDDGDGFPTIASASMWTRRCTAQFKQAVRNAGGGGGVLQVGHGEIVTVRVPTHTDGRCLFWEFATDNFDIGFGVYFEWAKSPTSQVTVHISESDDDRDLDEDTYDDDEDEIIERCGDDLESGSHTTSQIVSSLKPPMSIIIPIYRRDSHLEVYAGSHPYPGEGVYLLKFDNSFSLWRSKTLYYRVYYTH